MSDENRAFVVVVSWYNADQFKKVYEYLYSSDFRKKQMALDTISVWETRCHPSLPTAIEATYVLTSACVQDVLWTNKLNFINHTDLQGIYGSAITRFVSLSVEVNKNRDVPTYSIAEVAKSIGIPSFIVDVRNEWCHSVRPSLSVLRLAAQHALKYLKESYWDKEAARVNNFVKQPLDETEVLDLFKEYIQFHDDILLSKKEKIIELDDGTLKTNPEYVWLIKRVEKSCKNNKQLFVKVLVSDGIFIPTDEDFKAKVSKLEYALFNSEHYSNDFDDCDKEEEMDESYYPEFDPKIIPEIPDYHESLWEQIISILNRYDAMSLFLESLLKSQGNRTIIGQKVLISWIYKILNINSACGFTENCRFLKKIFRRKGLVLNWFRLLYSALVNPSKYTLPVLPLILENLNIKREDLHSIISVASIKLGLTAEEYLEKDYFKSFHTVEDLKEAKSKSCKQPLENIWSSCPDDCYKSWPIGYVTNIEKDKDDAKEEMEGILESCSESTSFFLTSNKNEEEEDDDDKTFIMSEEPDLSKIISEVENRDSLLYKRLD